MRNRPLEKIICAVKLKKNLKCEIHDLEKSNYCMDANCKMPLCPECYIEGHIGHKRLRMKELYEDSKLTINAALESLEPNTREF